MDVKLNKEHYEKPRTEAQKRNLEKAINILKMCNVRKIETPLYLEDVKITEYEKAKIIVIETLEDYILDE